MTGSLLHVVPSNLWSGRERYALDICRHFRDAGWDVTTLTRDARIVDDPFVAASIRVRHAPFHSLPDLTTLSRMARLMRGMPADRPAVVHVHRYRDALRAMMARRLARRPDIRVVATRHKVEGARRSPLYRWIYRNLDAHIFVSRRVAEAFGPAPANACVLLNSVYDAPAGDPAPPPGRGAVTAMYHGPLRPDKGLETLIDAMGLLRGGRTRLRLRLMGTGNPDYVDALRRRAQRRGVMDAIDWRRHDPDPLPSIATVHFGVVPSVTAEAFCMPNAEYMAMGRPVICSATGAQPEYLDDGEGAIFVPPANAAALAKAIRTLAADPELRRRMGQAARRAYAERLAWPRFAERLAGIYLGHI